MNEYYLMNKDKKLLLFRFEEDYITNENDVVEVEKIVDNNLLPPGFSDIKTWIDKRDYAKHKNHLKKWLTDWGMDSPKGFCDVTHCLGLNDTLWVKPADSPLEWRSVSLYTNPFSDIVSETAFETGLGGLQLSTTSPEFTSEGSFDKCWFCEDEQIYLLKKGSHGAANLGKEMYSEFYASQISELICKNAVCYDLVKFKGEIVSKCNLFTNENIGFVPFYRFVDTSKTYSIRDVLNICAEKGFEDEFRELMVLDSIILNEDRHLGNFGFLVNNDTFEIIDFAPAFDHNMSLLSQGLGEDFRYGSDFMMEKSHKLGGDFTTVGQNLVTNSIKEKLRQLTSFKLALHNNYNLDAERLAFIEEVIHKQSAKILSNNQIRKICCGR